MTGRGVRPFYGWLMVSGLGVTELVSWGVLVYAFSVLVVPMRAELGWSMAELNAAYATGVIISGLLAIPVGRVLQAHGARGVMTTGTVATVVMLLLWSTVDAVPVFFCVFAIGGLAMATTLYEPVFAVTAAWFDRHRPRAVLVLTVFGGLASVVFVPLTATLVNWLGWRDALLVLAGIAALTGLPVHGMLVRRRPADLGLHPDGAPGPPLPAAPHVNGRIGEVLRSSSFRWITLCLVMSTGAKFAVSVVLVVYLTDRGYSLTVAALAAGSIGVPGRRPATGHRPASSGASTPCHRPDLLWSGRRDRRAVVHERHWACGNWAAGRVCGVVRPRIRAGGAGARQHGARVLRAGELSPHQWRPGRIRHRCACGGSISRRDRRHRVRRIRVGVRHDRAAVWRQRGHARAGTSRSPRRDCETRCGCDVFQLS
jgi:hypothetical protein